MPDVVPPRDDIPEVLSEREWTARAAAHRDRVDGFVAPHRRRLARGERHPVWDFFFTYYSFRPRKLRVWHPGHGTVLAGAAVGEYLGRTGYVAHPDGVTVGAAYLQSRLPTVRFIVDLLRATAERPPQLRCFGMHEWAMVYRSDSVRHGGVPLRLGGAGTDAVVESMPLRCSHFDAYRFFTEAAAPRNLGVPTRAAQPKWEQPGCLHANMDLYKWCYKLGPLVDSDLMVDCLELAAAARELDMRASPYDLRRFGLEPIPMEEARGRAEYVRRQGLIARQAAPLRSALLSRCRNLLAHDGPSEGLPPAGKMTRLS